MIAELRLYIDNAVTAANPLRSVIEDPFGDLDLSNITDSESYKFYITSTEPFLSGNIYGEMYKCSLDIYDDAVRDVQAKYDELFEEALCIKYQLQKPELVKNQIAFTDMTIDSIEPFKTDTNDNLIGMRLLLTIRRDYVY